tara:strand:+ start:682 stop:918 length:237 start_codon:yes stop_codon:yes gene_type:complete
VDKLEQSQSPTSVQYPFPEQKLHPPGLASFPCCASETTAGGQDALFRALWLQKIVHGSMDVLLNNENARSRLDGAGYQ